jgi:hypothetical protein
MVGNSTTTIFDINTSGWTWSFWVKYVTVPAVLDTIMATKLNNVSPSIQKFKFFDNRSNDGATGDGNGYSTGMNRASPGFATVTSVASTVPTGSWINLNATFTYTGARTGTFKIYKDGSQLVTEDLTVTADWTTINSFLEPVFGAFSLNGTYIRFQNFQLAEVLYYNRPLTDVEINKNYNITKSNYGKSVSTNGLKLHLDAYNTESYSGSGSTWNDLSNSGYNMTIGGATWATSGGRKYFELDGVNDYIVGSANTTIFDLVDSFTWSMWVYWPTSPGLYDSLIQSEFTSSNKISYILDNRNTSNTSGQGFLVGTYGPPASNTYFVENATITTGAWTHMAWTLTRNSATSATITLYRNGSQLRTSNLTRSSGDWRDDNNSTKPVVGALLTTGTYSRFNNIRVGEVLNYNRALISTEITNNYNATKSNYGL